MCRLVVTKQPLSPYGDPVLHKGVWSCQAVARSRSSTNCVCCWFVGKLTTIHYGHVGLFPIFSFFTTPEMPFPMLWCFGALHVHCQSLKQCDPRFNAAAAVFFFCSPLSPFFFFFFLIVVVVPSLLLFIIVLYCCYVLNNTTTHLSSIYYLLLLS